MHAALPPSVIVEKPTGEGVQALSSDSVTEFQAFTRHQISFGADMARTIGAALK
jgi:hypothetical protein